jgi:A/G-specific adenine glycosylase
MVDGACHDEQQIRKAVDVPNEQRLDRRLQSHHSALGAAADRPRQMQRGARFRSARKNEVRERRKLRLQPVDPLFEPRNVGIVQRRFDEPRRNGTGWIRELGAHRKQIALDPDQRRSDIRDGCRVPSRNERRVRGAEARIGLVHRAVCIDARIAFRDAHAPEKRCLASVTGSRVNFHGREDGRVSNYMTVTRARKAPRQSGAAIPASADRRRFRSRLLAWYRRHGRDLPWRRTSDPYHILVSEIMLQQTQVDRVLPKYAEWLAKYPSLDALAAAPEHEVAETWYPLGYNIRPKRLQTIARESVSRYGGRLPAEHDVLLSFKGIGPYTAGAIRSFAFRQRAAILDTNVARVLFRVFVGTGDAKSHSMKRHLWRVSEVLVPVRHVFDFNQALMDFGAMVCVARNPKCLICPMKKGCRAYPFDPDRR